MLLVGKLINSFKDDTIDDNLQRYSQERTVENMHKIIIDIQQELKDDKNKYEFNDIPDIVRDRMEQKYRYISFEICSKLIYEEYLEMINSGPVSLDVAEMIHNNIISNKYNMLYYFITLLFDLYASIKGEICIEI